MAQLKARITEDSRDPKLFGYELVDPVGNIHAINPEPLTTFPRAQAAAARLLSCSLTPMAQEDIKMKQVHAPKGRKTKATADAPAAEKKPVVKKKVAKKAPSERFKEQHAKLSPKKAPTTKKVAKKKAAKK